MQPAADYTLFDNVRATCALCLKLAAAFRAQLPGPVCAAATLSERFQLDRSRAQILEVRGSPSVTLANPLSTLSYPL